MKFKQKLGYMCIGCLFTITGYIIASLGGGATHAQQDEQIDKIVCRQLEVVNKEGKTVARIDGFLRDMNFYNPAGKVVASISVGESGGLMSVRNPEGKNAAGIFSVGGEFGGIIQVYDSRGKLAADIYSDENGGGIEVFNAAEKVIALIEANKFGGVMSVRNAAEKVVAGIIATEDGGGIEVRNAAGKEVVGIGTDKDGDGVIKSYKGGWRTH